MPEVFGIPNPVPEPPPGLDDDDIYQKVKALRRSVQEVNELVEAEKEKSQMVRKRCFCF